MKDFVVKDIALAEYGRQELDSSRNGDAAGFDGPAPRNTAKASRFKGARIAGSLHMTVAEVQTAVLIETLATPPPHIPLAPTCAVAPPATSSPHRTTSAPRSPKAGTPVFAVKGETLEEYLDHADPHLFPLSRSPRPT